MLVGIPRVHPLRRYDVLSTLVATNFGRFPPQPGLETPSPSPEDIDASTRRRKPRCTNSASRARLPGERVWEWFGEVGFGESVRDLLPPHLRQQPMLLASVAVGGLPPCTTSVDTTVLRALIE